MSSNSDLRLRIGPLSMLALLGTAAVLLVGCGSGGSPAFSPSTSAPVIPTPISSTSAAATPTQSAVYKRADTSGPARNVPVPVLPEAAKTETKAGLEAFTRYWFQLVNYGYETGDTAQLSAITGSGCVVCERVKQVQTEWHESGRWLVGGKISTPAVSTTFRLVDGQYQVAVQVSQGTISHYRADGSLATKVPKAADTGHLVLARFQDGAWFVDSVDRIVS